MGANGLDAVFGHTGRAFGQQMLYGDGHVLVAVVTDGRRDLDRAVRFGAYADPVLDDIHGRRLDQPHMAVDPRPFIEPALAQRSIDTHGDDVGCLVGIQEIGDVDGERRIGAAVFTHDVAVDHDDAVARHAVELEADALAGIGRVQRKGLAVPADAGLRIVTADRLVAMVGGIVPDDAMIVGHQLDVLVHEGQLDRPVVRQVNGTPLGIVELDLGGVAAVRPLLGIGALVLAEVEVLVGVVEVTEGKAPPFVQTQALAWPLIGGLGPGCGCDAPGNGQGGSGGHELATIETVHGRASPAFLSP